MNTFRFLVIAMILTASALAFADNTVERTFVTAKDTFITNEKQGQPGDRTHRNYGAAHSLHIDTQYTGEKSHVLIEFDLSDVPKNATITAATLTMGPRIDPKVGAVEAIELRRLLRDDWQEGAQGHTTHHDKKGVSWVALRYTEEGPVLWQEPGAMGPLDADIETAITLTGREQWETLDTGLDVLDHARAWHENEDRDIALGWIVRTTNTKINLFRWASSNAPEVAGPTLELVYTAPEAEKQPDGK